MMNSRILLVIGIVAAAALTRIVPHIPNVTPVDALALFGGAWLADRRLAFAVPLAALMLSDAIIGAYGAGQMVAVYACSAATVAMGIWLRRDRSILRIGSAAIASSLLFFTVSNFAVWAFDNVYPHTPAGLITCYVAAIPFLRNTIAGDLLYAAVLFGGFGFLERRMTAVRERQPAAS